MKVHVWAGLGLASFSRATEAYIIEGKMDASFYIQILENNLLPFISSNFPSNHNVTGSAKRYRAHDDFSV